MPFYFFRRSAGTNLPALTLPSPLLFRCAGSGEGTVESADRLTWTPEIVEHLAEHGVSPEEFEEVVGDPESEGISRSTDNPLVFGYTSSGRMICCVFRNRGDDVIEPVTAFELEE